MRRVSRTNCGQPVAVGLLASSAIDGHTRRALALISGTRRFARLTGQINEIHSAEFTDNKLKTSRFLLNSVAASRAPRNAPGKLRICRWSHPLAGCLSDLFVHVIANAWVINNMFSFLVF